MAGQSDAADDLIAELAKLMAQDAHDDRKAPPASSAGASPQMPSVRIPGGATSPAPAAPATEFLRSLAESRAERAKSAPEPETEATPAPSADSFDFDFGLQRDAQPTPAAAAVAAPAQAAPAPAVDAPSPQPDVEHDSIADLISAEMTEDEAPQPVPESVAPQPRSTPTPAPVAAPVAASASEQSETIGSPRTPDDRFKIPPVFGLGSTAAAAAAPAVQRPPVVQTPPARVEPEASFTASSSQPSSATPVDDPIDEIESLIGRAMNVEFDRPIDSVAASEPAPVVATVTPARPAPSPALRSLATPTLPAGDPKNLSAADRTIFAAAQASGAKVGWVTPPVASDPEPDLDAPVYQSAPRQRGGLRMSRALAGPLVALTLLLAAGFGLYWVLGLGSREDGPAPLLTADTSPTKEAAPAVAADEAAAPQSVVFSEMDGATPAPDEQLLSRDQTDVNEVTQAATPPAGTSSDEGLANRKVRTVKVRPDGTIVSGDDSVAGSAILPVDRPNVPAIAGAETAAPELLANVDPVEPVEPVEAAPVEATPEVAVTPVEPGSTVDAVDLAGNPIAGKTAVVPRQRPAGLRLPSASQAAAEPTTLPAATAPALAASTAPAIAGATEVEALGNDAPAYVQLASQRDEAAARQSAQNMVTRYGPLFGGANLEVQRVDLGAKGIYYRVRVPANSVEQANMICTNVKAAGGDCFTM